MARRFQEVKNGWYSRAGSSSVKTFSEPALKILILHSLILSQNDDMEAVVDITQHDLFTIGSTIKTPDTPVYQMALILPHLFIYEITVLGNVQLLSLASQCGQ